MPLIGCLQCIIILSTVVYIVHSMLNACMHMHCMQYIPQCIAFNLRMVHPHQKNWGEISWKCTHPQSIQAVDEFVSWLEQIWGNVAFHHLLSNGSSAVNGCRQNKSPNSWLKHHNNPHHSSPAIHVLWGQKLRACEKQRKTF